MHTSEDILFKLGYSDLADIIPVAGTVLVRCQPIMDTLANIDQMIEGAYQDAMASKVGDLQVDFVKQISLLKQEGSRHLRTLANLVGQPVKYNCYQNRDTKMVSAYSIPSYR